MADPEINVSFALGMTRSQDKQTGTQTPLQCKHLLAPYCNFQHCDVEVDKRLAFTLIVHGAHDTVKMIHRELSYIASFITH